MSIRRILLILVLRDWRPRPPSDPPVDLHSPSGRRHTPTTGIAISRGPNEPRKGERLPHLLGPPDSSQLTQSGVGCPNKSSWVGEIGELGANLRPGVTIGMRACQRSRGTTRSRHPGPSPRRRGEGRGEGPWSSTPGPRAASDPPRSACDHPLPRPRGSGSTALADRTPTAAIRRRPPRGDLPWTIAGGGRQDGSMSRAIEPDGRAGADVGRRPASTSSGAF
jgi:hypothetical protein